MTFGEDPRQGYFEGSRFYHPQMRFQLTFPEGWKTQNTAPGRSGGESQPGCHHPARHWRARPHRSRRRRQFLSQEGVQAGNASTSSINGLPAASSYFQAQTEQGSIEGLVSFISYGGQTFGLMGYTPAGKLGSYDQVFQSTIRSFGELRDHRRSTFSRPGSSW